MQSRRSYVSFLWYNHFGCELKRVKELRKEQHDAK